MKANTSVGVLNDVDFGTWYAHATRRADLRLRERVQTLMQGSTCATTSASCARWCAASCAACPPRWRSRVRPPRRGRLFAGVTGRSGTKIRDRAFPCAMNAIRSTNCRGNGVARARCVRDTWIRTWPQQLLEGSEEAENKRYAVYEGRAYRAQQHAADAWHGYPVGWVEVPEKLRNKWLAEGRVQKKNVREHWDE